jgi:hypothetical protein
MNKINIDYFFEFIVKKFNCQKVTITYDVENYIHVHINNGFPGLFFDDSNLESLFLKIKNYELKK